MRRDGDTDGRRRRAERAGKLTNDRIFRLLARLWTLKRMLYYVYGGWAQGINLNEYLPAVAYLFGKQTYDESTQEMQYCDEILRRRFVATQQSFLPIATVSSASPHAPELHFLSARSQIIPRMCGLPRSISAPKSSNWHGPRNC